MPRSDKAARPHNQASMEMGTLVRTMCAVWRGAKCAR